MERDRFQKAFLLLLVAFISMVFVEMVRPYLIAILLAAIFSGMAAPFYQRIRRLVRGHRHLASAITLLILLLLVFIPFLGFLGIVATQAIEVTANVRPWVEQQLTQPNSIDELFAKIPGAERLEPYRNDILQKAGELVQNLGSFLVAALSSATKGTAVFFFQLFLLLYTMFFFLVDGKKLLRKILYYIPLEDADEARMVDSFVSVTRATLKGTLIIGLVQGGLAGAGFWVAGIDGAVFWAAVMAVLSIIPGIGVALVWIPAVAILIGGGHTGAGLALGLWCGLVVGSVDNFLRPRLVGRDTKMHDLLILFSTLGGIVLFGVSGFIIGPIIAALFVTVWDIYGTVFKNVLPAVHSVLPDED